MTTLEKILWLKDQKGLSDLAFEKRLNLKSRVVDSWKRGNSKSYFKIIPELSEYFNVSADFLLGRTNDPLPQNINNPVINNKVMEAAILVSQLSPEDQQAALDFVSFLKNKRK